MFVVVFTPKRVQVCCRMLAGFERRSQWDSSSVFSRAIRSETMNEKQRTKKCVNRIPRASAMAWHQWSGVTYLLATWPPLKPPMYDIV
jgi:hypothetical protein